MPWCAIDRTASGPRSQGRIPSLSNCRGSVSGYESAEAAVRRSAYPSTVSVIVDIAPQQPSAKSCRERMQQRRAQKTGLFDHLVGAQQHSRGNVLADRLGRLEVV